MRDFDLVERLGRSGMRVLVTAASKYGATGEIAQAIAEVFTQRGWDAMVVPSEQVQGIDSFDAVVLGSAVYAGRWLKPARELVDRSRDALAARPVWVFSSGPIGDPPKPEEDPVDIAEIMEATKARAHRVFAGKLVKKQLSFAGRAIAAALRVPEGDFRDWDEIKAWAAEIADAQQPGS
jgi:menaquinone-dependent protoporphyrinogen oxidase